MSHKSLDLAFLASCQPATRMVHAGVERSQFDETAEAIYMNSGYTYASAEEAEQAFAVDGARYVYSRFRNPTVQMFEDRLASLEGAEACRATASGMAAVFAALACLVKAGDRIVASRALFGSCTHIIGTLFPTWGIEPVFVDPADTAGWERAINAKTTAVFLETPSNPSLHLVDIHYVSTLAHAVGATVVVDNAFATPLLQSPLRFGADVVIYSATKHIDGQGRSLGGAILGTKAYIADVVGPFLRNTGPCLSPFNAWLLLKGLETLELRVERSTASALELARFLETRPEVARVAYPFLESHPQYALAQSQMSAGGTMLAFDLKGGKAAAFKVLNVLRVALISNNLGDSKSLITHPATTTHQKLSAEEKEAQGITEGLLRLSVGLEAVSDLRDDFARALGEEQS